MTTAQNLVYAFNEWDPLEECIVGKPDMATLPMDKNLNRRNAGIADHSMFPFEDRRMIERTSMCFDYFMNDPIHQDFRSARAISRLF